MFEMIYHEDFRVWFAAEGGKCSNCGGNIEKGEIIFEDFSHENRLDICSRNKGIKLGLKEVSVNNYGKIEQVLAYVSEKEATEEETQRYLNRVIISRNIKDLLEDKIQEYTSDLRGIFGEKA